jgi:3-hydroxyisobutyrate dehydrogenase
MQKIGIVGLGIMGRGMANNFLKKGHEVFAWNRTSSVVEDLVKNGVIACYSPAEVSRKADLIFEVTANAESSKQVWLGENGIFVGADDSKILVASATLSINWVEEFRWN